jgi:hypothetical protein
VNYFKITLLNNCSNKLEIFERWCNSRNGASETVWTDRKTVKLDYWNNLNGTQWENKYFNRETRRKAM